jgi:FKBP-type peptidyl-prolyl cis-trans isomerase
MQQRIGRAWRHSLQVACAAGALLCSATVLAATPAKVTLPDGLQYIDTQVGDGEEAKAGKTVTVHYTGWLSVAGSKGKQFDSSVVRDQPFEFHLGAHQVIKGWDEGVAGMKEGGKRTLIIPPQLGYGAEGAGDDIPPNSTLIFDVELLNAHK